MSSVGEFKVAFRKGESSSSGNEVDTLCVRSSLCFVLRSYNNIFYFCSPIRVIGTDMGELGG